MIVLPMAGLSSRFAAAGYDRPKYTLPLGGRPVFDHAVGSFARYFDDLPFMFVFRETEGLREFLGQRLRELGVKTSLLVGLDAPTAGQAETVALGLRRAGADPAAPVTVFNIDTFRPAFDFPDAMSERRWDGYLEVFRGSGDNWSFVEPSPAEPGLVARTAEKQPISDLCCTGLYHFAAAADLLEAYDAGVADAGLRGPGGELYVAPLYNALIGRGRRIGYHMVPREDVIFCGVPEEYEDLRADPRFRG